MEPDAPRDTFCSLTPGGKQPNARTGRISATVQGNFERKTSGRMRVQQVSIATNTVFGNIPARRLPLREVLPLDEELFPNPSQVMNATAPLWLGFGQVDGSYGLGLRLEWGLLGLYSLE